MCVFAVIFLGWIALSFYEAYQTRRLVTEIGKLALKRPEFRDLSARQSDPGLISIVGTLESRKDLGLLVHDVREIIEKSVIGRPQISFGGIEFRSDPLNNPK